MKTKHSIRLLAVAVLASTLLLGACGNKKEEAKNDNANKTTQTTSSSKASSSNKDSKTQASTSTTTSEKAKASSEQASSPTTQNQESNQAAPTPQAPQQQGTPSQPSSNQQASQSQSNQASQSTYDPTTDRKLQDQQAEHNKRYKGVLTMVDGDFSAAAGNWKGANGETITVSSGGQFTVETADGKKENYSIRGYSYTLDDGKYNAKIGGGKIIQITTGADGTVSSVALIQPQNLAVKLFSKQMQTRNSIEVTGFYSLLYLLYLQEGFNLSQSAGL